MKKSFKLALSGIFATLALLSFILENLFPPLFLPGARMGISNIFILLPALILGGWYAVAVLIIKTTLGSLFVGNISAVMYSLPAGLVALGLELILIYLVKNVSLLATSIVGAVVNVSIQNIIFCLITNVPEFLVYLPYLALLSVISGSLIGLATFFIIKIFPQKLLSGQNKQEIQN